MSDKKKVDKQRVVTPEFRVSFPKVFKPDAFEDQAPKYSCVMLFKKSTDLSSLKKAVHAAKVDKWGADESKWPKSIRSPFKDGDEKEDLDGYKGHITVNASNKHRPEVVDQAVQPITEESQAFYAGCYARAAIRAFAYGGPGTKFTAGVSFSLESIQKLREGESFSGKRKAADVFDTVDMDEVDADGGDSDW